MLCLRSGIERDAIGRRLTVDQSKIDNFDRDSTDERAEKLAGTATRMLSGTFVRKQVSGVAVGLPVLPVVHAFLSIYMCVSIHFMARKRMLKSTT